MGCTGETGGTTDDGSSTVSSGVGYPGVMGGTGGSSTVSSGVGCPGEMGGTTDDGSSTVSSGVGSTGETGGTAGEVRSRKRRLGGFCPKFRACFVADSVIHLLWNKVQFLPTVHCIFLKIK